MEIYFSQSIFGSLFSTSDGDSPEAGADIIKSCCMVAFSAMVLCAGLRSLYNKQKYTQKLRLFQQIDLQLHQLAQQYQQEVAQERVASQQLSLFNTSSR